MWASLWFVPMLMSAAAVALAIGLLNVGNTVVKDEKSYWLLYTGTTENARELLSALLSGMISLTALVVSITMVVLTLAAGQIGPRLIRSFIQDRVTQAVLGLFLADILYLLVVFRTVGAAEDGSVPHLAVSTGTGLTALCLLILLFFINRLARSIIYDTVVREVAAELHGTAERLMPPRSAHPPAPPAALGDAAWVELDGHGYVQTIDIRRLVETARAADAVIRLAIRPGLFVLARGRHVAIHPPAARTPHVCRRIAGAVVLGSERTPAQDIEFGLRQMVEVGTRALSPGLNDVFTAMAVIDNLSASLAALFGRALEPSVACDGQGQVRVVRVVLTYEDMVTAAFDQIRHAGASNPTVLVRLLDGITRLAPCVQEESQRAALLEQVKMIRVTGEQTLSIPRDLDLLRQRAQSARQALCR